MKKLALCLALLLALSALAGLAGAEAIDNPTLAFAGRWADPVYDRASLRILRATEVDAPDDELYYDIRILWGNSYDSMGVWYMTARWDEAAAQLVYADGVMSVVTTDDNGVGTEEIQWDDAGGAFWLDEDGVLRWEDSREERAAEFRLARVVSPTPGADDFAARYFGPIASVERGTAGSSLKQAALVHDVIRFAADADLWNTDIAALRDHMLAAWQSLDADAQARFDANLLELIADMANEVFDDYASLAGVFEDAGVGEDMAYLSEDADARLSWETLFGNTLTMGNSED